MTSFAEFRCFETVCFVAVARLALLPRLFIATIQPTAVRELPLRAPLKRPITLGAGMAFAKVFAARCVGPFATEFIAFESLGRPHRIAIATRAVIPVIARAAIVMLPDFSLAAAPVRLATVRSFAFGPGKVAFGELLVRSPGNTGTAFAAGPTVRSAPGIVVFVVVAGHEGLAWGARSLEIEAHLWQTGYLVCQGRI